MPLLTNSTKIIACQPFQAPFKMLIKLIIIYILVAFLGNLLFSLSTLVMGSPQKRQILSRRFSFDFPIALLVAL